MYQCSYNCRLRTLSVLTNGDNIDIVVLGLVSLDGLAWSDVGKEGEGLAEHQVHRGVTGTDWGSEGSLQTDLVLVHRFTGWLWQNPRSVGLLDGVHIALLPRDWGLQYT